MRGPAWPAQLELSYRATSLDGDTLADAAATVKRYPLHLPRSRRRRLARILAERLPRARAARDS